MIRVLLLWDKVRYKDGEEIKAWADHWTNLVKNPVECKFYSLNYPWSQHDMKKSATIMNDFNTLLDTFQPDHVICRGPVSLSILLQIHIGINPKSMGFQHVMIHHSISAKHELMKRMFSLTHNSGIHIKHPFYFSAMPFNTEAMTTKCALDKCIECIVEHIGNIAIKSQASSPNPEEKTTIEVVSSLVEEDDEDISDNFTPNDKNEIIFKEHQFKISDLAEASEDDDDDDDFMPMFFSHNPENNVGVVCGRRMSDNSKVYKCIENADWGVYVAVYGTLDAHTTHSKYFGGCKIQREVEKSLFKNHTLVSFCGETCNHSGPITEIRLIPYHESFKESGGVPTSVINQVEHSICRTPSNFSNISELVSSPSASPKQAKVIVCNQHLSPVTRMQLRKRMFFSSKSETVIKSSLRVGYLVELGKHFSIKGVVPGHSFSSDMDQCGSYIDYDIIYALCSVRQLILLQDEIKVQWEFLDISRRTKKEDESIHSSISETLPPVTIIDPRNHGLEIDDLEDNATLALEQVKKFVEDNSITSRLVRMSQKVGLCSLGEKLVPLKRSVLIYTRALCDLYPDESTQLMIASLSRPKNRKKHAGGFKFNVGNLFGNDDDEEGEEEEIEETEEELSETGSVDNLHRDTDTHMECIEINSSSASQAFPVSLSSPSSSVGVGAEKRKREDEKSSSKRKDRGIHFDAIVLDFASNYPRDIIHRQVSPERAKPDKKVLPFILTSILKERKLAKESGDVIGQDLLKLIANIFYGFLSYYFPEFGAEVTKRGRDRLEYATRFLVCNGVTVFFGDTDSLFTSNWPKDESEKDGITNDLVREMLEFDGSVLEIKQRTDVIVCCENKTAYFYEDDTTKGVIASSMFQDMPSQPQFFRDRLKEFSVEFLNLCKSKYRRRLPDFGSDTLLQDAVMRCMTDTLKKIDSITTSETEVFGLASKTSLNLRSVFPNIEKNGNKKMIEYITSCTLHDTDIGLEMGYVYKLDAVETYTRRSESCSNFSAKNDNERSREFWMSLPFWRGLLSSNKAPNYLRLNQEYMLEHYFLRPLAAMINRAVGLSKDETRERLALVLNAIELE